MSSIWKRVPRYGVRWGATAAAVAIAASAATAALAAPAQVHPEKPAGPITVVYVEVNDNDMSSVADYTLEGTNAPVFDVAVVFAANINKDDETGEAYLHLNERVTETLDDAENQIEPLQERGTQVLLSILGNHQGVGFANFQTPEAAGAFAQQVADVVEEYGLDGIDLDDEWAEYQRGEPINPASFVWFVTALRQALGEDKIITLYNIGPSAEQTVDDGVELADGYLDYIWNPFYGSYRVPETPGAQPSQLGAGAAWINRTAVTTAATLAARTVEDGLGAFVTYDLKAGDQSEYLSAITQELYGLPAAYQAEPVQPPDTASPEIELAVTDGSVTVTASDGGGLQRVAANLYDEANSEMVAAIGSTSAQQPIEDTETTQTWDLPIGLAPGVYTVRAAARDLAGNIAVTTETFTVRAVELAGEAQSACLGDLAYVAASAANGEDVSIDIRISGPGGDEKTSGVAPGGVAFAAFPASGSELPAGRVTIAGYYFADGSGHYEQYRLDYEAISCA